MTTRRDFLLATGSLAALSSPGNLHVRAFAAGSGLASMPHARTLIVVDETIADADAIAGLAEHARIVRVAGDAGLLWHRELSRIVEARLPRHRAQGPAPALTSPRRVEPYASDARVCSIEGWTTHADYFVISTFAAAASVPIECTRGRHVAWRIRLS